MLYRPSNAYAIVVDFDPHLSAEDLRSKLVRLEEVQKELAKEFGQEHVVIDDKYADPLYEGEFEKMTYIATPPDKDQEMT